MVLLRDVGQVETHFGLSRNSVNLDTRQMHCLRQTTIDSESFWPHLIVHLGDVDQAKAHFDPFGDSFNLSTRQVHDLRRMYHRHGNDFRHT
jgi:hypothetical protein